MESHCFDDDIVFEILTRLPPKSLMRFSCVSKAWNTLIRYNLYFVKSHGARSQARPAANHLLFELEVHPCDNKKDVAFKEDKKRWLERFSSKLLATRHYFNNKEMCICSNHCNGLVCLYSIKDTQVYLLNVTTGEIKALSFNVNNVKYPLYPPILYLGFDLATEKYKLLHIFLENDNNNHVTKIRIRTLGTNSCWRNCCCMPSIFPTRCNFLNGVLYWAQFSNIAYILSFDLRDEKFRSFSLPEEYSHFALVNDMHTALKGKLVMHLYNRELEQSDWIYDDLNKVFTKFINYPTYWEDKMIAFSESEKIDMSKQIQVLATTSISNASSAYLVFPRRFLLKDVSYFVENIIPLSFLV